MKSLNFSLIAILAGLLISMNAVAGHDTAETLEARIAPVGKLNVVDPGSETAGTETASDSIETTAGSTETAPSGTETASAMPKDGESLYNTGCIACHAAGIGGAPKLGDAAAWKARIAQGNETLYDHAINGFQGQTGFMIPRGGNAALSDDEVKAAVDYMVKESQ